MVDISNLQDFLNTIERRLTYLEALTTALLVPKPPEVSMPVSIPSSPAPAPVPPAVPTAPLPVSSTTPGSYSLVIRPQTGATNLVIDRNDTLVDLGALVFPNLAITLAVGVKHVRIQNGSCKSIYSQIVGDRAPCYDDLEVENVTLTNTVDSTMELHGSNTRLIHVTCNAQRYSLWLGQSEDVKNLLIDNCTFTSAGPESTVRVTDCFGIIVRNSTLTNGMKHCLRVHGKSSLVTVANVKCSGAGNGIAMGYMGPQVPGDVTDVVFDGVRVETTGPDVLNLARDGSLKQVNIKDMTVRSPRGPVTGLDGITRTQITWDLVKEYQNHPADWNVLGLKDVPL